MFVPKQSHLVPTSLLLLTMMCSAGCASILATGETSIMLDSQPSGATVHVNGKELGTTPYNYSYHPDDGANPTFELRQSGYQSATISLRPKRNNMVLFADAMLLHIPYPADKNNPKLYSMPMQELTVNLYKEPTDDQVRYLLPITGLDSKVASRTMLGTLRGKPARLDKDSPFRDLERSDMLTSAVTNGLRNTWLDTRVARPGTTKGDEALQKAKMYLWPEIGSMQFVLTGDRTHCYGPVMMELDWRVMSSTKKDSVLFTIPQQTTWFASGERPIDVVQAAMTHAARVFAHEPALPGLMAQHYGSGLALSKGSTVELHTPKPISFTGRKEMLNALVKGVVTIQTEKGHGSGFMITNDGYIITNEHVVGKEAVVKVKFEQGFTLEAQVVKTNKDFDLALLKTQASDLPALSIGDDNGLLLGEEIFAIGTPLDASLGQSVSRGVLSGRRELDGRTYLQTDVSINPGNSGGPFLDEDGRVVGVATMKISGKGLEGLGFGVPISVAMEMLNIRMIR